ncbi:tripartite tricarboxylate transporter substrate binding protein [Variovorax sp. J22R133]|uniref:Bug family tripartite tricarboxylate transporter substrate binding protein n=1 Tax=Variovorax brevis TaxID=3053503 RepID=UPI0025782B2C|nr:tripartite tricarboxylate transporter substrate binding protein [Variovorax sp. J22R133]MDM0116259.1 tripartite tricarboxylate transporter substrate binding protein [Variovorax sp. J22R133]
MTVVVPYTTGGSTDVLARVYASGLAAQLGESVIVENRVGAGGTIGANYVAGMPADGRTLLYTPGPTMLNQEFLLKGVKFRPLQTLLPLAKTCDVKVALVAGSGLPANDLREFISLASKNPGKKSFAYYGDLSVVSIAAEAGIDLMRVPYKGGAPGMLDVAAGNVDIIASSLAQALPLVQSGKIKLLAVMGDKRWPEYPNVPTVKEILPGYQAIEYQGVFLPIETPKAIVDALWTATSAVLSTPEYRRSLAERGATVDPLGPDDFKKFVLADQSHIKKIVEKSGIQPE